MPHKKRVEESNTLHTVRVYSVTPPEALVDVKELSTFLKLGKTKIFELIHQEGLPVFKFGTAFRFDLGEIREWLRQRNSA